MTSFVYYVAASLDGFIDDEEHSLRWLLDVPTDDGPDPQSFMSVVGVQVMGSHTYEWLVAHEDLLAQPQKWQEFFGAMPTRVFSSRDLPVPVGADVEILRGPVNDHIDDLCDLAGGLHVWIVGGGELAGQFLDAGALDRLEVSVAPVLLGAGEPLLPRFVPSSRLTLDSVERAGEFAVLTYVIHPLA